MTVSKPRKDHPAPPNGRAADAAGAPTFEERLAALEGVVQDLEGEELPLETSLQRYREGVEHLRACRGLLDDAERRLAELVAEPGSGGEVRVSEKALEVSEKGLVHSERDAEKRGNHASPPKKPAASCDEIPF
jgi:exodeoxyribonuclease VII small subunit